MNSALRFERHQPAPQFVELRLSQRSLTRAFGRIDTPGVKRLTEYADEAEAQRAQAAQQLRLERAGYLAGHQHPALLAAIRAAPDDPAPYSVYADWLLERQDPRGELIANMIGGVGEGARALLGRHDQLAPSWWKACGWAGAWRWGFLQKMTCPHFEVGAVRRLLRHPSAAVLQELAFTGASYLGLLELAVRDRPPTLLRVTLPSSLSRQAAALVPRVPGLVLV